jgi:hypothetical protein
MSNILSIRALFAFTGILALASTASAQVSAQSKIGARFGTRDPVTCPSFKEPHTGPISAEHAKRYFMCGLEGAGGQIFLVENLVLEVGEPKPVSTIGIADAAADTPAFAIRGSFVLYGCTAISTSPLINNKGKNCSVKNQPNARGWCYKNVNDDWRCNMVDTRNRTVRMELPPPAR